MAALLHNAFVVKDKDGFRSADGAQAVGNGEHRAPLGKPLQALLNKALAFVVQGGGCLVKNEHRRVFEEHSGDGNTLLLSAGKLHSAFAHIGLIAIIKLMDKLVRASKLRRFNDLLIGCIRLAVENIVVNRSGEKVNVLLHNADVAAQALEGDFADVAPVKEHLALGNVIKARN